ncbi:aminodeoxychorismate synthase component I [Geodermatophilus sabuli]|uniref:Para-aminobenzoate synthetase / 4-amino-4-deoxychorismate lyase n=1 Tax=Geodermatophilus sabuli TaxID=1564158 RepID=A0A285EDS0_9ACTN|nr:aminodeoxychorismate synthase component I [Geodermatophilus sabuli]MBB3084513.1 para-aminobenzoate synthetase/4-amino-4-deoxychorismate lyase [Geodermatophilus sabuli]SNX97292.1 para-aminobenzoate synthetase / 4-amino-4-deoxychorismate lyase [Geodermatophilus sabuli]
MSSGSRPGAPWARFDDLRAGTAVRCPPPRRVLVAERPEEVLDVLTEVERATDAGQWAFGYLAYEAAAGLDPQLAVHGSTPMGMPLVWFGLCDEPVPVPTLEAAVPAGARPAGTARWRPTWTPAGHARGVRQVQERIAAGDTFQCNLTVRVSGHVVGDPFLLYQDLALSQRGAHNAYLDLGRFAVASASPELFFERRGDHVLLRPMKGTARRGRHRDEDRRAAEQLRSSAKERAENVMIVDLMRSDIGRVAEIGSVDVPALFTVEHYETVLQLTSDVTARLRPGTGLVELFGALFPCGSVTGAPKSSSMEIIRSVEPEPRGVYCGAIGLVGPPDAPVRARFTVAIRTAVVDSTTGEAVYGTGGGITWSSEAAAEHDEVLAKAAVLRARPREFELMETMRFEPRRGLRNGDRHLQRLADSAEHLGFRFDLPAARRLLEARLAGEPAARVRLRLGRSGTLAIDVAAPPGIPAAPVLLAVDDEPVDPGESWLYHKTSMREPYDRRRERRPDVDDVIMVNVRGELTEVTRATLAVRIGGRWWTPPLGSGCLPGVERARLLETGRLAERVLHVADLGRAEGVAVLSSLRGWRAARLSPVRRGAAPRPGPVGPVRTSSQVVG